MSLMTNALREITQSKTLSVLMHILLDLGNALNGSGGVNPNPSHRRGGVQLARGFKLESLAKLKVGSPPLFHSFFLLRSRDDHKAWDSQGRSHRLLTHPLIRLVSFSF